jgi:two-component sensor histidine kinase
VHGKAEVTLVLDELVTNIVSYGVLPGETRSITLWLSYTGGVHIARSFMDSLDWRYDGSENHLMLVKRVGAGA